MVYQPGVDKFRLTGLKIKRLNEEKYPESKAMQETEQRYSVLFKVKLTNSAKATLPAKSDPCPKHFRSRPLPFAVKGHVDKVQKRLEKAGITI